MADRWGWEGADSPERSRRLTPNRQEDSGKHGDPGSTWYKGFLPGITKAGELTGGETFVPHVLDREALAGILSVTRDTALSQYVVGFSPDAAAKPPSRPKKHSLAVALTSKSTGKIVGGEKTGVTY